MRTMSINQIKTTPTIQLCGSPILKKKTKAVENIDSEIIAISEHLINMGMKSKALGVAANQLGFNYSLFVYRDPHLPLKPKNFHTIINPYISEYSSEKQSHPEGCLSFPGFYYVIERSKSCLLDGLQLNGLEIEYELSEFTSTLVQHEYDHLQGKTIVDHLNDDQLKDFRQRWFDTEQTLL